MKQILGLLLLLFIVIAGGYIITNKKINKTCPPIPAGETAIIDNHSFKIEVAKSDLDKQIGLSKYSCLPQDSGMIFPFGTPSYYGFWMKNMKFPIDIIYIAQNHIVSVFPNVPVPPDPGSPGIPVYKPSQPADTVLEINAGLSRQYNFKIGDSVQIKNQ